MPSSKQGEERNRGNPLHHTGRGFASMDPERQREIAGHDTQPPERDAAQDAEAAQEREPAGKKGDPAGTKRVSGSGH